eukprot:TRINITY_DN58313_c0_g1_i10.p1 TRINITY_DN58313_c0_g1~~TRINITY_DN58313_c0_g1_i10.p1  ORF type:complete len:194 (+),score=55.76 TRINITY_DN58313_c0_g1_i10:57-638(+)
MLREYGKDTSVIGQNVLSGAVIAPISLYDPDMLQPTVTKSLEKLSKIQPILETVFLHEVDDEGSDEPALGNFGNPSVSITGLDKLVEQSIIRVSDIEVRKSLAKQILLVGGSTKFPGFVDELEEKLIEHLPRIMQHIELVDVLDPKESDHSFLSWKGAAIVAQCDSFKGCIVSKHDWNNLGLAVLKAKAPFHI